MYSSVQHIYSNPYIMNHHHDANTRTIPFRSSNMPFNTSTMKHSSTTKQLRNQCGQGCFVKDGLPICNKVNAKDDDCLYNCNAIGYYKNKNHDHHSSKSTTTTSTEKLWNRYCGSNRVNVEGPLRKSSNYQYIVTATPHNK